MNYTSNNSSIISISLTSVILSKTKLHKLIKYLDDERNFLKYGYLKNKCGIYKYKNNT